LTEGSRWFRASDTTGLLSRTAAYPGGVAEIAVNVQKAKQAIDLDQVKTI
jgi:hypothetical protein